MAIDSKERPRIGSNYSESLDMARSPQISALNSEPQILVPSSTPRSVALTSEPWISVSSSEPWILVSSIDSNYTNIRTQFIFHNSPVWFAVAPVIANLKVAYLLHRLNEMNMNYLLGGRETCSMIFVLDTILRFYTRLKMSTISWLYARLIPYWVTVSPKGPYVLFCVWYPSIVIYSFVITVNAYSHLLICQWGSSACASSWTPSGKLRSWTWNTREF